MRRCYFFGTLFPILVGITGCLVPKRVLAPGSSPDPIAAVVETPSLVALPTSADLEKPFEANFQLAQELGFRFETARSLCADILEEGAPLEAGSRLLRAALRSPVLISSAGVVLRWSVSGIPAVQDIVLVFRNRIGANHIASAQLTYPEQPGEQVLVACPPEAEDGLCRIPLLALLRSKSSIGRFQEPLIHLRFQRGQLEAVHVQPQTLGVLYE